jgi:predicted NAD/FAD-dependent oxidoreductase
MVGRVARDRPSIPGPACRLTVDKGSRLGVEAAVSDSSTGSGGRPAARRPPPG